MYITGLAEGSENSASASTEISLSSKVKVVDVPNKTYEVVISGETYVGEYVETLFSPYYCGDRDHYLAKKPDGIEASFWINRETNKLVIYSICNRNGYQIKSDDKTYEDCLQIAYNALKDFDPDGEYILDENLTEMRLVRWESRGNVYSYVITKMISDKKTNILVTISVNTDGLVVDFNVSDAFRMGAEDEEFIRNLQLSDNEYDDMIEEKVLSTYSKYDPQDISWTKDKTRYTKLKDGKRCVMYDTTVYMKGKEECIGYVQLLKYLE